MIPKDLKAQFVLQPKLEVASGARPANLIVLFEAVAAAFLLSTFLFNSFYSTCHLIR
jgi:hypothetical protein